MTTGEAVAVGLMVGALAYPTGVLFAHLINRRPILYPRS